MSEDSFSVEDIIDKRIKSGKIEYLIKWTNYSINECTWEPLSHLNRNCDILIKNFEKSIKKKKKKISLKSQQRKRPKHKRKIVKREPSESENEFLLSENEYNYSYDEKTNEDIVENNLNHQKLKEIIQKVKKGNNSKKNKSSLDIPFFPSQSSKSYSKVTNLKDYFGTKDHLNHVHILKNQKSFSQSTNYKNPFLNSNEKSFENDKNNETEILELTQSESEEIIKKEENFKKENLLSFKNHQNELKEILNLKNNKSKLYQINNDESSIIEKRTPILKNLKKSTLKNGPTFFQSSENNFNFYENLKEPKKVRFKDQIQTSEIINHNSNKNKAPCALFFNNAPFITKNILQINNIDNKPIDTVLNTSHDDKTKINTTNNNNSNEKTQIIELEMSSEYSKTSAQIENKEMKTNILTINNIDKKTQSEFPIFQNIESKKNNPDPFYFHLSPIKSNSDLNNKIINNNENVQNEIEKNNNNEIFKNQLFQYHDLIERYSKKMEIFSTQRESENSYLSNFSNQTIISNDFEGEHNQPKIDKKCALKNIQKIVKIDAATDVDDLESYKMSNFTIRPIDTIEISNTLIFEDKLYLKLVHTQKSRSGKELKSSLFVLPDIIKKVRPDLLCSFYEKHMNFV